MLLFRYAATPYAMARFIERHAMPPPRHAAAMMLRQALAMMPLAE